MDNITHSLIGIAAAEPAALRARPEDRVRLWVASAVANNLPDLDVLYAHGHDRLTSMLHHRGYTHTLLLAPVQGLLWLALLRFWWRKDTDVPWRSVALLCLLGPFLHVLADSWNSYGVHPFWPVDNRWYYGDLIFIVEPWIWAILLPPIWKRSGRTFGQALSLLLLALLLGLAWYHPYVVAPVAAALTIFVVIWLALQRALRDDRRRIAIAGSLLLLLFGVFGAAEFALKRSFAAEGTEIAALAQPGNPFCWTVLAAGFTGDRYRAAAWTAAPLPSLVPAPSCSPFMRTSESLAPLDEKPSRERVALGAFHGTRADYDRIVRSCRARAYLRFARIPVWQAEGKGFRLGDLRFDRSFRFGEQVTGDGPEECMRFEPPWVGRFYPSEVK